ncbi:uncharacterized protein [Apostichopus japonicus]|uniref:uncharacterized protein n=1 Tax=Stichopus japonicus TaxID=307972 RepID=UPI003AB595E6
MGGQLLANVLLPVFAIVVLQWDYTTGTLPAETLQELNSRTQPSWEQLWIVENVPTVDCTVDAVQLHIIACSNDVYKDHEGSRRRRSFGFSDKRRRSIFLNFSEANNFLAKTKRTHSRVRRTTTFSTECCDKLCIWEEVGEYCWHSRVYH